MDYFTLGMLVIIGVIVWLSLANDRHIERTIDRLEGRGKDRLP